MNSCIHKRNDSTKASTIMGGGGGGDKLFYYVCIYSCGEHLGLFASSHFKESCFLGYNLDVCKLRN